VQLSTAPAGDGDERGVSHHVCTDQRQQPDDLRLLAA